MNEILKKYQNTSTFPIPIIKLCNELGIKVYKKNLDNRNGYIEYKDGNYKIYVNEKHAKTRQRFTIGHEIGHFINDKKLIQEHGYLDRENYNNGEIERKADKFSADLLMAKKPIKDYLLINHLITDGDYIKSADVIKELATLFSVSIQAMILRLRNLHYNVPYNVI